MSEVNLNFVVDTYDTTFTVENVDLTFTPTATELGIYTGGYATAAGSSGQVQYNNGGVLAGNTKLTFNASSSTLTVPNITSNAAIVANNLGASNTQTTLLTVYNLATLGNVANIRITGGSSGQSLKTYGNGVVYFGNTTPGGSNTQVQYNNNGTLAGMANVTYAAGNIRLGAVANVKITGGANGQFLKTDGNGNLSFTSTTTVPSGSNTQIQYNNAGTMAGVPILTYNGSNLSLGTISTLKILGGSSGQVVGTDGTGNLSWVTPPGGGNTSAGGANTQMQFNDAGVLNGIAGYYYNKVSNQLTLTATSKIQQGKETTVAISGTSGTINAYWLDGAIFNLSNNLTANVTIALTGNSSTTFDSVVANGESVTIVVITNIGSSKYFPTTFTIDGSARTVKWVNGVAPVAGAVNFNSTVAYTYTMIKTSLGNYNILGTIVGYY